MAASAHLREAQGLQLPTTLSVIQQKHIGSASVSRTQLFPWLRQESVRQESSRVLP